MGLTHKSRKPHAGDWSCLSVRTHPNSGHYGKITLPGLSGVGVVVDLSWAKHRSESDCCPFWDEHVTARASPPYL
jgi:hypothetical protein